jgi:hypothetical protein
VCQFSAVSIVKVCICMLVIKSQKFYICPTKCTIYSVPGGNVNILGGHSIVHSQQKSVLCTCVLLCRIYNRRDCQKLGYKHVTYLGVGKKKNGPNKPTYLLTPWSKVLLEKLTVSAATQEIPRNFGTRRFLTVPTSARHLSLS